MGNLIRTVMYLLVMSSIATAQETTFQGEWRLNPERSEFAGSNSLNKNSLKVEQSGTSLTVFSSDRAR